MAKTRKVFTCESCGHREPKWFGRCPKCRSWGEVQESEEEKRNIVAQKASARGALDEERSPVPITDIKAGQIERFFFGIHELDRVLGGGLVPGSIILLGGDPGIGKSTLSLQMASQFVKEHGKVLYVSGEESLQQTYMRARRVNALDEKLLLLSEVDVEKIKKEVLKSRPGLLIVDSIQSVFCADIASTPGAVTQLRESTARLMHLAKRESIPTVLIGHVTKDGVIAGPRVLEHLVDTVLYFEGERGHTYRILRAVKNRFGSTNEIGVFEMKESGLAEVKNPSSLFLDQRPVAAAGSVVTVCLEGTRPLLVEVQALVGNPSYGTPRRTCAGVEPNRVALLVAVLEKMGGVQLSASDIFVNVAGGFRIDERASDLAVLMALASSFRGIPIPSNVSMFGEVGLAGEVRGVGQANLRLREAMKLGFSRIMMPENNKQPKTKTKKVQLIGVRHVKEAVDAFFHGSHPSSSE